MKALVTRMVRVQVPHPKTGRLQRWDGHVVGFTIRKKAKDTEPDVTDDLLVRVWKGGPEEDPVVKVPFDSTLWKLRYPDKKVPKR